MKKIDELREIYGNALALIKNTPEAWNDALKNISQYYKLSFAEGLLVAAQAKSATTVATYDTWRKFGRYVNRGEHGIGVITSITDTTIKYLFDISQTSGRNIEEKWILNKLEKKKFLSRYNSKYEKVFTQPTEAVNEIFQNALRFHENNIDENLTEFCTDSSAVMSKLVADSAMALIMYRCGAEKTDYDFTPIMQLTNRQITAVGETSLKIARETLLEIEHTLRRKNYETERNRLGIPNGRGNGNIYSENKIHKTLGDEHRSEESDRYVQGNELHFTGDSGDERSERQNIRGDSTESHRNASAHKGNAEEQRHEPDRDRSSGRHSVGSDNESTADGIEESGSDSQLQRALQMAASAAVNDSDEYEKESGLSGKTESPLFHGIKNAANDNGQLSLFDDNIEISETGITNAEITQDMIDYVLTSGSNERHSIERIVSQFEKNKGIESNAEFMHREFGIDGKGFEYQNGNRTAVLSAWYDKDGIRIAFGKTAHIHSATTITWEQAAERVGELLTDGKFTAQDTLDSAEPYTRKKLAETLWYLHQDVEVDYFIPTDFFKGGFEVSTVRIAEALRDETTVQKYIDGMSALIEQYKTTPDVLRFHYHKLPEMLEELKDLQLERIKFKADPSFAVNHKYFISEDEKDQLILSGSNVAGGKFRINEFFRKPHTEAEKENFLKNEYGIGGTGRGDYNTWHDSKGLALSKGTAKVTMKWSEVASRISRLVAQNSYITQEDIDNRIRNAKWVVDNADINDEKEIEQANNILSEYGITYASAVEVEETAAEAAAEKYAEFLDEEVMRGSGYIDGKFRIFDYFRENKPNAVEFAEFLRSEYGNGGHNGEGNVSFVSYTDSGIDFSVSAKNGTEHISFTWEQTAAAVMKHIENHDYITADDINDRILQSQYIISYAEKNSSKYKAASDFLLRYGILDKNAEITKELFDFETVRNGETSTIKFDVPIELWERFSLNGLVRNNDSLDEIVLEKDENECYFCIPDKQGALWNKVNVKDVLTPAEMDIVAGVTVTLTREERKARRTLTDNVVLLAENQLASDEMDELGEKLFDYDNAPKYTGLNNWIIGANLNADELDELTARYHSGEDINAELAKKIYGNMSQIEFFDYSSDNDIHSVEISTKKNDNGMTFRTKGGFEITHSWEKLGDALITAAKQEFDRHNNFKEKITITCDWSESPVFEDGKTYSVAEFDKIMADADKERNRGWKSGLEKYGSADAWCEQDKESYYKYLGYDKTKFTVNLPDGKSFSERQDIGDGYGGVLDYLSQFSHYAEFIPLLDNQRSIDIINELKKKPITNEPGKIKMPTYEEITQPLDKDKPNETEQPSSYEVTANPAAVAKPVIKEQNFRYTENVYAAGAKAKYRDNIAAIKKLYEIEKEKRPATPEEQVILSKYVGWGGLSKAFDSSAEDWKKEYYELKSLLDDKTYNAAILSTRTAYYTDPDTIIKPIFSTLERFGFNGGKILDPAMGTGNFFSVIPDSMAEKSQLTGVEIDELTGRIAKKLYPNADVKITAFERTSFDDESFDAVVGNVPFDNFTVYDKTYTDSYLLHDYFFIKSLDKLKAGGIAALITSSGTMDKISNSVRIDIAKRAELIGAVRLPITAFKAIAGTEVTTDVIFLKKRDIVLSENELLYNLPEWAHRPDNLYDEKHNYIESINRYYLSNPDMILGTMQRRSGRFGDSGVCVPKENQDLKSDLEAALMKLNAQFSAVHTEASAEDVEEADEEYSAERIEAPENARNFCFYLRDNRIWYCENGYLEEYTAKNNTEAGRIKGLCEIADKTQYIIDIQISDYAEEQLKAAQKELTEMYDVFVKKYGCINSKANLSAFHDDLRAPLVSSIEYEDEEEKDGQVQTVYKKADIFTKATVVSDKLIETAKTSEEALYISLNIKNKVDIEYMSHLCSKEPEAIIEELGDKIYLNPINYDGKYDGWELAEEYLSGYVKDKLETARIYAKETPELFARNVSALEENQPEFIPINCISYGIGTIYIPSEMYRQFMYETFQTSSWNKVSDYSHRVAIDVKYNSILNSWQISGKNLETTSVNVNKIYGTERMNAYEIMEASLNLKRVEVKDKQKVVNSNGDEVERYVLNKNETLLARERQAKIENEFHNWILSSSERISAIENIYNSKFNVIKPRSYDGAYLKIPSINPNIKLRPHQKDVIARIVHSGSALMAHEVGAGKTAAMAAAGIYMRSIGIAKKPIYVVPKPIVSQWGREFMRFFPTAKILVTSAEDFTKENRRRFLSKIATGDFDAIIMGQTQFEKIPLSLERQERAYDEKIMRISNAIAEMEKDKSKSFSVKQLAATRKSIEKKLEKLRADFKKDDFITFEKLGADFLFVDEAHNYKNLALFTKMNNVSGVNSSSDSQRASDMEMKIRYMQEINNGGGVVLATGTPVSNTLSELYVMQHYLQPQTLHRMGLDYFDNWASVFGKTTTALEVKPSGNGFRMKTRFSEFHNLPELTNTFMEVFDIRKTSELGLKLPEIVGGKPEIIVCEKSPDQELQVEEGMKRAEAIESGTVDRKEDNMLAVCTYMTKVALDARIIDPDAEDYEGSKVNRCISKIVEYDAEYPGTAQVVFCDTNVPQGENKFSVYNAIRDGLVKTGRYSKNEIAFIHEAATDIKRDELFRKVNAASIRVIIGSTGKLGTGVNIQEKLIAAHHLDAPYRPADLEQRNGRLVRQGNTNEKVHIVYYSTRGTFDSYRWQLLEKKQFFISQVMSGKPASRSCQDIDDATLTFSEMKAATTENPLIAEKLTVDNEVSRLTLLKNEFIANQRQLTRNIEEKYPLEISETLASIEKCKIDIETVSSNPVPADTVFITVNNKVYTEREAAGKAIMELFNSYSANVAKNDFADSGVIGTYRGLNIVFSNPNAFAPKIVLKGQLAYTTDYSYTTAGSVTKIMNLAKAPEQRKKNLEQILGDLYKQLEASKQQL